MFNFRSFLGLAICLPLFLPQGAAAQSSCQPAEASLKHSYQERTATSSGYNDVSFYVSAHQDDWQLFMGANAQNDISNYHLSTGPSDPIPTGGSRVVFIYTTAGDLGDDDKTMGISPCANPANPWDQRNVPYYLVREAGAINSINLAANKAGQNWCFEPFPNKGFVTIGSHQVYRYEYRNTISYFLRLKVSSFNSMANTGNGPGLTVDGSTTYANWCDYIRTIAEIYRAEMSLVNGGGEPWLNIPDYDDRINPNDHNEHYLTSKTAIQAAVAANVCMNTALYVDYETQNMGANLGVPDTQNEAGLVAVYCLALVDHHLWAEWISDSHIYQEWCARNYYRTGRSCDVSFGDCQYGSHRRGAGEGKQVSSSLGNGVNVGLYPNPGKDLVTISLENKTSLSKIIVCDSFGTIVLSKESQGASEATLNVSSLKAGIYRVIVDAGTTGQSSKKVMKLMVAPH